MNAIRNMRNLRTMFTRRTLLLPALLAGLITASHAAVPAAPVVQQVTPAKITLLDLAIQGNKLVAVGERGVVVESTDGGRNWSTFFTPSTRSLTSVVFVDDKTLVAAGHGATLLRSEDGGATWQAIVLAEIGKDSVLGLLVRSDKTVIAYGAFGMYLESTDAGKTWKKRTAVKEGFDRHISQVIEAGEQLVLVGESGTIAVSKDKGTTWSEIKSPYAGSLFGAIALRDGALLIYGMRGNIYRSTDGGVNWSQVAIDSNSTINGGSIDASGRVVLVGNGGLVAISTDNGLSFALRHAPEGLPLAQARFLSDGSLVYVGYLATGHLAATSQSEAAKK